MFLNDASITLPINTIFPRPRISGIANPERQGKNTIIEPVTIPFEDIGKITLKNFCVSVNPKSSAASSIDLSTLKLRHLKVHDLHAFSKKHNNLSIQNTYENHHS
mgnify:CR=1 FL=1